ncbi:MAG: RNA ligase [Chloroflexota bacterium]
MAAPTLADVLDPAHLATMVAERYIRVQHHPTLPLRIYNYTEKTQFGRVWNTETLACRGLIVDDADRIVARPLRKFFNLSEHAATFLPPLPVEPFTVFEKLDGSLGIRYVTPDGPAIATRGSFTSEQALWATAYYRQHYGSIPLPPNLTYLFEIVAPQFRVVVDYGNCEALVLLAVIDNATGLDLPLPTPDAAGGPWPGPVVERFDGLTDLAQMTVQQRDNAEGFVLRYTSGLRVKVKHAEYLRLHRILLGLSNVAVWEQLAVGGDLKAYVGAIPDEWYGWLQATVDDLRARYAQIERTVQEEFAKVRSDVGLTDRKAFALAVQQSRYRQLLFLLLDGRDYQAQIWRLLKPAYNTPFRDASEGA